MCSDPHMHNPHNSAGPGTTVQSCHHPSQFWHPSSTTAQLLKHHFHPSGCVDSGHGQRVRFCLHYPHPRATHHTHTHAHAHARTHWCCGEQQRPASRHIHGRTAHTRRTHARTHARTHTRTHTHTGKPQSQSPTRPRRPLPCSIASDACMSTLR
jgi:hypothetical protein